MPGVHPDSWCRVPPLQGLGCSKPALIWCSPVTWEQSAEKRTKWWGRSGRSLVVVFHPSFGSGDTFRLKSLLLVLTWGGPAPSHEPCWSWPWTTDSVSWFHLSCLDVLLQAFLAITGLSVGSDSHHQTCSFFLFGYCGDEPWSARTLFYLAWIHPHLLSPWHLLSSLLLLLSHKNIQA